MEGVGHSFFFAKHAYFLFFFGLRHACYKRDRTTGGIAGRVGLGYLAKKLLRVLGCGMRGSLYIFILP